MTLLDDYRALIAAGALEADAAQAEEAAKLDTLVEALRHWRPKRAGLSGLFDRPTPAPKGRYIFGAIGRGKTMLMDLFYAATKFKPRRRLNFHAFMSEVHDLIGVTRRTAPGDPIPEVARTLASRARLLCFDELDVTDVADAMLLGRLFEALFEAQVVLVATSNVHPADLYKDGLNRQLFAPFIDLLMANVELDELKAAKDFRLAKLSGKPLYFCPADRRARAEMDQLWHQLTSGQTGGEVAIDVKGRTLHVARAGMGIARFSFAELCERPLGTLDYLALARNFHTIMIDNIPAMTAAQRSVARRFVNLIDTLYDARVCLIASAAAEPKGLLPHSEAGLLVDRTVSRLIEMRSEAYLEGRGKRIKAHVPA
jgi:cell division protein ZapE